MLTLCLGITLPSNAAGVSVSDGSAFITKSELSYQLNNLSIRMTQLENSLDSKIDLLVSSYLTRNGIWNAVKQTIITNNFEFPYPKDQGAMNYGPYDLSVDGPIYNLFKANKSGLAFVNLYWKSCHSTGSQRFWGYRWIRIDTTRNKNVSDDSVFISLYFLNESNEILTTLPLSNAKGAVQGYTVFSEPHTTEGLAQGFMVCAPCPPVEVYLVSQFFVNKDEMYKTQFRAAVITGYSDGVTAITPQNGQTKVWFSDANVY